MSRPIGPACVCLREHRSPDPCPCREPRVCVSRARCAPGSASGTPRVAAFLPRGPVDVLACILNIAAQLAPLVRAHHVAAADFARNTLRRRTGRVARRPGLQQRKLGRIARKPFGIEWSRRRTCDSYQHQTPAENAQRLHAASPAPPAANRCPMLLTMARNIDAPARAAKRKHGRGCAGYAESDHARILAPRRAEITSPDTEFVIICKHSLN